MRMLVRCWALLAFALTSLPLAATAQDSAAGEDPAVATVNGEPILRSEVLAAASNLPAQYQGQLAALYPLLVQRLVDMKLLGLAAEAAGLAGDAEVERRLDRQRSAIMREVYVERMVEETATEAALKARYETFIEENPAEGEVSARHILLENEADAQKVIADLDAGGVFADLARERSKGPSSGQGGDLGFFTKADMVPEFSEAAFALEPGQYTKEPVQTQFGWHVILVEDRRSQEAPSFEEMENQLRSKLAEETVREAISALRADATIEMLDQAAPGAATEGQGQQ